MFLDEAGAKARHIPYKGVGPMLTDLIGGQVEFATAALPSVQAHLKSGALRAIGVATAQRAPAAPEIPTFVEQGLPGYVVEAWFAVVGPKGMAAADVKRVHDAVAAAFADPAVKEAMAKQGNTINVSTPEYAQAFFRTEMAKYAKLVKKAGHRVAVTRLCGFAPRLLLLSADPALVRAQLAGASVSLAAALPLRDDVSTDEISPLPVMVHFDATLGRYPYTGFTAGGERPIGRDAVQNAGIEVVVAGKRYGKGSSREHSVVAERAAGVRLVIAESFERIYRQNADNVGLLHQHRLRPRRPHRARRGDRDRRVWSRAAMRWPRRSCARAGCWPLAGRNSLRRCALPPSLARRRCSRRSSPAMRWRRPTTPAPARPGDGGFVRADWRFIHEYYTGMCAHMLDQACRRCAGAARAADHRRLRRPPVLRASQPGARARRPGRRRARPVARAPRLRGALRPASNMAICSRSSTPATSATPARRASRMR